MRELAERQHGVFARRQVLAIGIGPKLIDYWLATKRIEAVHRGVFAFSDRLLSRHGRWLAAVLAIGPDAVLSHRSAAALWRMRADGADPAEVTTGRRPKRRPGIRLHCLPLGEDERTVFEGIPVTTPGRTLLDIAGQVTRRELERAIRETDYLRLWHGPSLVDLIDRYPGKTGIPAARMLLEHGWSAAPTRSGLEAAFTDFVDEYGLPVPERNALIDLPGARVEVDALWRRARVVAELDGYESHGTRHAFEADRERDMQLQLAGFQVVRITPRRLHSRRAQLARDIRRLLGRGGRGRAASP